MSKRNSHRHDRDDDDRFDHDFFDFFHFSGHHGHGHHHNLPLTYLNATLDITATDGNGHTLNGSGNPASGWAIQTKGAYQLGSDIHYRQGNTVQPVAVNDDGILIYNMPAGTQVADPAHGVPGANANRAAASFDFSFDTGVGPGTHQTIQQFLSMGGQFILKIDLDPTQDNDPLTLHAVYDAALNTGGSHVVWKDSHNNVVIADDGGNQYVTQNSQNYAFYQSVIDIDQHTPGIQTGPIGVAGLFDIEEQIIAPHHKVIADIHSQLNIGGAPLTVSHHHTPPTLLNATLDVTATDGAGHTLNGSGNPASGWEIQNNGAFQLGTDVHYRQGNTVQPVAVDDDGILVYNMPDGAQVVDPAHGVPTANANRAAASFDFSFDTGVGPGTHQTIQQFLASGGQFIFKIDLDPTHDNDPLTLHAVYDPVHNTGGSHVVWMDNHNNIVIADDGGNAYVTQNSQNYAFYQSVIDMDQHTPGIQTGPIGAAGTFDIEAQIIAPHHDVIADIHSTMIIV